MKVPSERGSELSSDATAFSWSPVHNSKFLLFRLSRSNDDDDHDEDDERNQCIGVCGGAIRKDENFRVLIEVFREG